VEKRDALFNKDAFNYESTKIKACNSLGLAVSEIYVFYYLYDEEEKQATPLIQEMLYKSHGAGKDN
jgi:hypothetical protein